jgi:hypothetical protein
MLSLELVPVSADTDSSQERNQSYCVLIGVVEDRRSLLVAST